MNKLAVLIGAVAIAGAGVFAGMNLQPGGASPAKPANTAAVATPASPGSTVMATPVSAESQPVQPAKPREPFVEPAPADFAFRRLEIDTSKDTPEACLVFTKTLKTDGSVRYEDYLAWEPAVSGALRTTEDRLCMAGLDFATEYALTMKKGLPSAGPDTLAEDETIPVQMRDRPSQVSFGPGFILPRESADGVPITTVNVDSLNVEVVRVGDRLLSQLRSSIVEERQFWSYDASQYRDEQGAVVWTGTMEVKNEKNRAVTTAFAIRDALPAMKPGIYLVTAANANKEGIAQSDDYWEADLAGQWIINTDLALTSFDGHDGLTVFVRSFASAAPAAGVKLQLVARNNEILGEAVTDAEGKVSFAGGLMKGEGGNAPAVVMAYAADGTDFAYLDLRRPGFDLTDRGVEGRDPAGDVDAFVYLDRGIYRPGETVQLMALFRDRMAMALPAMPVTIKVTKPDGQEFRTFVASELKSGGVHQPFTLTASAPRGRWSVAAYTDPNGAPVGSAEFDVQDFVPQKLKVTLTPPGVALDPSLPVTINVESRFLYGAPAAGLGGEGTLTIRRAFQPYKGFADYSFGDVNELFDEIPSTLSVATTDAEGKTTATASFDGTDFSAVSIPLEAFADVKIYEPGGRTTGETVTIPVKTKAVVLGLRGLFDYGTVNENSDAGFEAIALNDKGERIGVQGLTYEFVREIVDYRWYQQDGVWKYEENVRDRILSGGSFAVDGATPAKLAQRVEYGSYRLTIADPATGAKTSVRFYAGWGWGSASDRPDRLNVSSDKQAYASGETAKVTVRSPVDGKALLVVAGDKVHETRLIDVSATGTVIDLPMKAEWGTGVYAMVTLYRPVGVDLKGSPRAIGLVHLAIDPGARKLAVAIGTPEKILPRSALQVPVDVAGAEGDVYVTIAAIDEGVLQLTDFATPDPVAHFFGKRRLGVEMRDDYGRLIETERMQVGALRTGGDGFGGRGLSVVPQRVLALFAGPVKAENGKAVVTLDVPDFAGELRLMAVVWSPSGVGFAAKPVTVRDPVVAELVLPRFMAPGDTLSAGLNMHNVEGAAGAYTATIQASGPVSVATARVEQTLAVGERKLSPVSLAATGAGIATISMTVEGPAGFKVERSWPIEIRAPQLPVSVDEVASLAPGETYAVPQSLLERFAPGTAKVSVSLSRTRAFDNVSGMLQWLDRYPYGCLEQTTSRALPLVYFNDLAKLAGLDEGQRIPERVQAAVDRVMDMQRPDGSFGMWSSNWDSEADRFLMVYATDFLFQAKAKGFVVPQNGLDRALANVRNVASGGDGPTTRAYAFYVLARAGKAQAGDLRYYADVDGKEQDTALGAGFLGGALTLVGDRSRASSAFGIARLRSLDGNPLTYISAQYGSMLRDVAGVLSVAADVGETELSAPLVAKLSEFDTSLNYTTTQEKAWMLLAQWRLTAGQPPVAAEATGAAGTALPGSFVVNPTAGEIGAGVTVKNAGDTALYRTVSASGVPTAPVPASANGLTINKAVYNLDGTPANLATLKQNDRVVVVISGTMRDRNRRDMAIIDLLPAGWEIEGPVQTQESGATIYPWLPAVSMPQIQEARDDRYVAAFGVGLSYRLSPEEEAKTPLPSFTFAYVARATTAGTYALPGAFVEDMYAPKITGRTAMGSVTIAVP